MPPSAEHPEAHKLCSPVLWVRWANGAHTLLKMTSVRGLGPPELGPGPALSPPRQELKDTSVPLPLARPLLSQVGCGACVLTSLCGCRMSLGCLVFSSMPPASNLRRGSSLDSWGSRRHTGSDPLARSGLAPRSTQLGQGTEQPGPCPAPHGSPGSPWAGRSFLWPPGAAPGGASPGVAARSPSAARLCPGASAGGPSTARR